MGGLPRRATFIKQHLAQGTPTVIVDAGNLFASRPIPERGMKNALAKAELIVEAYEKMGYTAALATGMDLYLGREALTGLFGDSPVTLLSANLVDEAGKPVFEPFRIVKAGAVTVGIFGLTSPEVPGRLLSERFPGCAVRDPEETPSATVAALRKRCDLVVLLSGLGFGSDSALVREVEGIDVVIGGRDRRWMRAPRVIDRSLVTSSYYEGRAMGWLTLSLGGEVQGWVEGRQLDFLQSQLETAEGRAGTDEEVPAASLERLRQSYSDLLLKTRFDGNMVNLNPNIGDDEEMVALIDEYRRGLVRTAAAAAPAGTDGAGEPYAGAAPCLGCHPGRHRFWRGTDHARAMNSLVAKGAQADPDCLPCHTTGFDPGRSGVLHLGVQCEACHGRGSLHVTWPETYPLLAKPPVSVCTGCHTPDQDDDFVYTRDRVRVCSEGGGSGG